MGQLDGDLSDMPQVVILAGGLGTRLGAISKSVPKSLVRVGEKPVIGHILDWASGQGCDRALVLSGHLGHMFDDYSHPSIDVTFSREFSPLGTGGALWNSKEHLEDRFILLWGDNLHRIDYQDLVKTHLSCGDPLTMTVTTSYEDFNLEHRGGKVVRYDKRRENVSGLNGYEAGTSVVERSLLETYGGEGQWSWEECVYPAISGSISAYLDDSPFWDMGTPERLESLAKFLQDSRARGL